MPVEKSLRAYRETRTNCAQSVLCGFQDILNVPDSEIEAARTQGHGRAEGGRCGALHAALKLSRDEEAQERIRNAFQEKAGSELCREIRRSRQLRCDACVELAATLVQNEVEGVLVPEPSGQ